MKKTFLLTALCLSTFALAQNTLKVATGSKTGTYSTMFRDLGKVCMSNSFLLELGTGGSMDNVDKLLGNEVSLGFVQLDVLKAQKLVFKNDTVDDIKTLLPLYPEEVHVITWSGSGINKFSDLAPKVSKTGLLGRNTTTTPRVVAAWGGSSITAQVLKSYTKLNFTVSTQYTTQETAMAALAAKKVDAVIAVVGKPATWVKSLPGGTFKLVSMSDVAPKLAPLYKPAQISYTNLNSTPVQTVSIQSLLVTRDFKTAEKKQKLLEYKKCALKNLTNLQETEGFHPKWNNVTFKDFGWPEYK